MYSLSSTSTLGSTESMLVNFLAIGDEEKGFQNPKSIWEKIDPVLFF
jgi:hypothetical protein